MSYHEERLEKDLSTIRASLAQVSADVERAVQDAVQALLASDRGLAAETILADLAINRATRRIDRLCHAFVARHYPSAGVLRFISSVLRLDVALERVGDYAVTICREAVQLAAPPAPAVAKDLEIMADQVRHLLSQSMQAFNESNSDLARGTIGLAGHMVSLFEKVFDDLTRAGQEQKQSIRDLLQIVLIFIRLERIRAQAKNICEETIFTVEGKTKEPKTYRVLFLDEKNCRGAQLAAAFARKAFPGKGEFTSAGWNPAERLEPQLVDFLDRRGLSLDSERPAALDSVANRLADFHVIVCLEDGAIDRIDRVPYHTTILQRPAGPVADLSDEALETELHDISAHVQALVESLHGEEA